MHFARDVEQFLLPFPNVLGRETQLSESRVGRCNVRFQVGFVGLKVDMLGDRFAESIWRNQIDCRHRQGRQIGVGQSRWGFKAILLALSVSLLVRSQRKKSQRQMMGHRLRAWNSSRRAVPRQNKRKKKTLLGCAQRDRRNANWILSATSGERNLPSAIDNVERLALLHQVPRSD